MGVNFDKLLKPYREGGTQENPVRRSLSTIASALIYKNRLPADVVGAAILKTFIKIAERGIKFEGDGSYGSAGRELFMYIKREAVKLALIQSKEAVVSSILQNNACLRITCPLRTQEIEQLTRWNRFVRFWLKPRGLWRP